MNVLSKFRALLVVLLLPVTPQIAHAECKDNIQATTPTGDFTVHEDGTVTHSTTGLMWMRCSLGQSLGISACTGSVSSYRWSDAMAAAKGSVFAGYNDWRLPNKNELESIVEESCDSPAINSTVFPGNFITNIGGTPIGSFWSSSPYADSVSYAWYVDFVDGMVFSGVKSRGRSVRLVRAGRNFGF